VAGISFTEGENADFVHSRTGLLRAACRAVSRGSHPRGAAKRMEILRSKAIRGKSGFLPLPVGAVVPEAWLRDWALTAANGITGHLDEYFATFREAWKGYGFDARGDNPDGTGWPLEQSSYWLDGAVRLAYILDDQALIAKVKARLDPVVSGVLGGGESFIYWRPRSVLSDNFNSWVHSHMGRAASCANCACRSTHLVTAPSTRLACRAL